MLGQLQEKSENLYLEGRKLALQAKNPYFSRIDFTPNGKDTAASVYIGLGTVLDDNKNESKEEDAQIKSDVNVDNNNSERNGEVKIEESKDENEKKEEEKENKE